MKATDNIRSVIEDLVSAGRSGVLLIKRSTFGDPLITAYFYRGKLLHATSFVVKRMWWEGILNDSEVSLASDTDNLFRYAAERYGEDYLDNLISHAKEVMRKALEIAGINGWEVSPEVYPMEEYELERMFGLDIVRRKRTEKKEGTPDTSARISHSVVLSLINRSVAPTEDEGKQRRETPDAVLRARALGFFVLYVPGEDNSAFLSTLGEFSGTFRSEFENFKEELKAIHGTVAAIFPLFALLRFGWGKDEVWGITSDAKKVAYALRYMEEAEEVSEDILTSLSTEYGTSFAWREGDRIVVFGKCHRGRMRIEEFIELCSGYFDRFRSLIDKAVSRMPTNMPKSLRKIHVLRMLRRYPTPDDFKREFYAKFGIKLEG